MSDINYIITKFQYINTQIILINLHGQCEYRYEDLCYRQVGLDVAWIEYAPHRLLM